MPGCLDRHLAVLKAEARQVCGGDLAARIYLKRCANYMVNGVPPEWTGVESLSEK